MDIKSLHGNNKLREKLQDEKHPLSRQLYQEFLVIEKRANEAWVPLLGHDRGSHSGKSHIRGVEDQISGILESTPDLNLSPAESFILLCAVLFHDLGRIIDNEALQKSSSSKRRIDSSYHKMAASNGKSHHGILSAAFLLDNFEAFGFTDSGLVECISHVCAAHDLKTARNLREKGEIRDRYLDQYGRIRLSWLCALLTLADEMDNSYHRAAPAWLKKKKIGDEEEDHAKKGLRAKVSGCEINKIGKLLEVHLYRDLYEPYLNTKQSNQIRAENQLFHVWNDLFIKRKILEFWKNTLKQMHINITDACLNVNGHLIAPRRQCKQEETTGDNSSYCLNLILYIHKSFADKADKLLSDLPHIYLKRPKRPKKKPLNEQFEITIPDDDVCLGAISDMEKAFNESKIKWFIGLDSFQLTIEPGIKQLRVDRLLDTALQLRFHSHGISTLPWETLSTEAGFEHLEELKMIFHRLSLLSAIYFYDSKGGGDILLMNKLEKMGPKLPESINQPNSTTIRFIELDGEWSIDSDSTNDNIIKKTSCMFHKWVKEVIAQQEVEHSYTGCDNNKTHSRYMKIENRELSYLLNENEHEQGILFPESISYIYHGYHDNIGINMTISGPAGVGKSTLSMEILAKGKFEETNPKINQIPLYAYYSLEQPNESIGEMARKLGFTGAIHHALPERLSSKTPDKEGILFLPKLAPRTYKDEISDERLFWFRYNQIIDLLESSRNPNFNPEKRYVLTAIVIDSLNAFSRSELARQQIHQLFKLISWYGILGIHIIENDPTNESRRFQSEVEFLSDIAIRLGWNYEKYQYKTMEIVKSRCQRNVLGQHPFKIRVKPSNEMQETKQKMLSFSTDRSNAVFEIFPSLHTQVSRSAKAPIPEDDSYRPIRFSCNEKLNEIVHKDNADSGIQDDAFIVLQGRSGGHKLAIGMSYIHANTKDQNTNEKESSLILNLGQPINYEAVAESHLWWKKAKPFKEKRLAWAISPKVNVDIYSQSKISSAGKEINPPEKASVIYVINFHAGFLLPEEFLQAVDIFIEEVNVKNKNRLSPIKRILFNSTAHLPERYPLLASNPLFLHALVRMFKQRRISLMAIYVKGEYRDDRFKGLSAMSDINVNVYDIMDEALHPCWKNELLKTLNGSSALSSGNIRVITSDNVTGKDYLKRYALLAIDSKTPAIVPKLMIEPLPKTPD